VQRQTIGLYADATVEHLALDVGTAPLDGESPRFQAIGAALVSDFFGGFTRSAECAPLRHPDASQIVRFDFQAHRADAPFPHLPIEESERAGRVSLTSGVTGDHVTHHVRRRVEHYLSDGRSVLGEDEVVAVPIASAQVGLGIQAREWRRQRSTEGDIVIVEDLD